jgi:hypothetical protein
MVGCSQVGTLQERNSIGYWGRNVALIQGLISTVAEFRQPGRQPSRGGKGVRSRPLPAETTIEGDGTGVRATPAGSRVPNADTAGAVGIWQVARRAGAAFGRFPAANNC